LNRLPNNHECKRHKERFRRYEKSLLGHGIQLNVKFLKKIGDAKKKYYQFTAIDDCTGLRVLKRYEKNTQQNPIQFVDDVVSRLPIKAKMIQTDNGSEFGSEDCDGVLAPQ